MGSSSAITLLTESSWVDPEPAYNDQCAKCRVCHNEYPRRGLVIENCLQPMGDERPRVDGVSRPLAQRHLPGCERADNTEPGLEHDNPDAAHVHQAKPRITNPGPVAELADEDEHQPDHDEGDEQDVRQEKQVSCNQVSQFFPVASAPEARPDSSTYCGTADLVLIDHAAQMSTRTPSGPNMFTPNMARPSQSQTMRVCAASMCSRVGEM